MIRLLIAVVPLVILSLCPTSTAQVCVKGKPSPECQSIILTESSWVVGQHGVQNTSEFGGIYNLNRRHALGASVFLNLNWEKFEGHGAKAGMGIKVRYRYWLGYPLSLDVAPGVLLGGTDFESPSFFGHVALNHTESIGLVAQVDRVNRMDYAYTNYSLGFKVGSYFGLTLMTVMTLGITLWTAAGSIGS